MVYLHQPLHAPRLALAPQTCCPDSLNNFMSSKPTSTVACTSLPLASHLGLRHGKSIVIDGYNLSIPALVAAARHNAPIVLNASPEIRARIQRSRDVIVGKVEASQSVYGVSTGFGGSGKSFPRISFPRLDTHHRPTLQPILARPIHWPSELHFCNTSMQVSYPRPQMFSLLFLS